MENNEIRKTIVVTGSGRGIGAAIALEAANNNYNICLNYKRNTSAVTKVAEAVRKTGASCIIVRADVSNENDVIKLFDSAEKEFGHIDALVNNVGVLKNRCKLVDMSSERMRTILNTNIMSTLLCSKEAIKRMSLLRGGKGGVIVNISSAASRLGSAGEYVDYAASKGAIDSFTIGISKEVAAEGIRVNCVRPGFIHTEIHADGGCPDRVAHMEKALPMKRGGHPEEVAQAVMWLLSDSASYATGCFLDMAGGL